MKTAVLSVCLMLTLNACALDPRRPASAQYSAVTASHADATALCIDYYRSRNPIALTALGDRLSVLDRQALKARIPVLGMSPLAATCLYGLPQSINSTTTAGGRDEQWVYCTQYMESAKFRSSLGTTYESCGDSGYLYFSERGLRAFQNERTPLY